LRDLKRTIESLHMLAQVPLQRRGIETVLIGDRASFGVKARHH
jgi:hypothetical protein